MPLQPEIRTGPVLAAITCHFRKTLFYPGQVVIYSKIDTIKNTSFTMRHEIINDKNKIVAEAQDIIVLYDFEEKNQAENNG